jgi:hypothetical protein
VFADVRQKISEFHIIQDYDPEMDGRQPRLPALSGVSLGPITVRRVEGFRRGQTGTGSHRSTRPKGTLNGCDCLRIRSILLADSENIFKIIG